MCIALERLSPSLGEWCTWHLKDHIHHLEIDARNTRETTSWPGVVN